MNSRGKQFIWKYKGNNVDEKNRKHFAMLTPYHTPLRYVTLTNVEKRTLLFCGKFCHHIDDYYSIDETDFNFLTRKFQEMEDVRLRVTSSSLTNFLIIDTVVNQSNHFMLCHQTSSHLHPWQRGHLSSRRMTIIINYHEDFLLFVKSVNDYRLRNLEERYRIIYAHRHRIDTPNHTENTENTAANFPLSTEVPLKSVIWTRRTTITGLYTVHQRVHQWWSHNRACWLICRSFQIH